MRIGPFTLPNNIVLAPMAGVTDQPFRLLCKSLGAGMTVSEMVAANPALRETPKHRYRRDHRGESEPRIVQIAGGEPEMLAEAARYNVAHGAQIIDINMGCPAKKVCNKLAGSALLSDEPLVRRILQAVVAAVDVPVTLKIRTGPDPTRLNAPRIARIAEDCGIQALAVHGRTRADAYRGSAEYETIAAVKSQAGIPIIANGDIDSPEKARQVLISTGADGVMIGRAAQGRPWIFREIAHFLANGCRPAPIRREEVARLLLSHLRALHAFYGPDRGVRIARKHIGWYLASIPHNESWRRGLMKVAAASEQTQMLEAFFDRIPSVDAA